MKKSDVEYIDGDIPERVDDKKYYKDDCYRMDLYTMMIKSSFKYHNENHEQYAKNQAKTETNRNIINYLNHLNPDCTYLI